MIYILTIVFVLSPFALLYIKKTMGKKSNCCKNRAIEFWLDEKCIDATINILVTVAGVTLALLLTNFDLNKQEASKTIELLGSLDRELRMVQENTDQYYIPVCTQLDISEDVQESIEYYKAVPLIEIFTFESVLDSELVVTNMNQHSYAAMVDMRRAIGTSYNRLNSASSDDELIWELEILRDSVELMRAVIEKEISFQEGNIPSERMKEMVNALYENMFVGEGS